ncbi:MAG: DnaB-like helicase N-terminal domain-containing protein, partial [Natronospirillum sp.]
MHWIRMYPDVMAEELNLKTPPHSLEAEQSLLGALMLDNSRWDSIAEVVQPGDFYRPEHRAIFTTMHQQVETQQPIDVITLTEALERSGELEQAGDVIYLTELVENASGVGHLDAYARIVRERALLRRLIKVGGAIAAGAYEPEGRTAEELVDEAERAV